MWGTYIFVRVSADAFAGHLSLPRDLEVLSVMAGFDQYATCRQIHKRVSASLPFGGFIASHNS